MSTVGSEPPSEELADVNNPDPEMPVVKGGRRLPDILGVAWVVAAAIAVLTPALVHGSALGTYDLLSLYGLSAQPGAVVHGAGGSDQISQLIPWTSLAWTQVHQGHIPLWNPYSALGMPLAFNWNSATFSLPTVIGYLFPVRFAYTVQVVVTLVVAGTGAYFFGRILRLSVLACALVGSVFELSGAVMLWLGWPIASVLSWTGWLFAAVILILRDGPRARHVAFFALVLALAIYAGQPDALIILVPGTVVFACVLLALRFPILGGSGPIARPTIDLGLGAIAGFALAAPLALPGYQVLSASIISGHRGARGLKSAWPFRELREFAFAGLSGGRLTGSVGDLGVIVVVLAIVAIARRRREREVIALVAVGIVMMAIGFLPPVAHALNSLPKLQSIKWPRAAVLVVFALSALAGFGLDLVVRRVRNRQTIIWLGAGFLAAAAILIGFWISPSGHMDPVKASQRLHGFVWAAIEISAGLAGVAVLALGARRVSAARTRGVRDPARLVAAVWVVCATSFLVAANAQLWSSSSYIVANPRETALQRVVGSSLVGFKEPDSRLGIYRDINDVFGVRELDVIDGAVPRSYFRSWKLVTGQPGGRAGSEGYFVYSPGITSATVARVYGVGFVLVRHGQRGPIGAVFQRRIGAEDLYRITNSGPATLTPLSSGGALPPLKAVGRTVPVSYPSPSSWKVTTDARSPQVLRLHLNNTPGWHASIDGRALPLLPYAGAMLQARIPSGHHVIALSYWPNTFTAGIVLATVALLALVVALVSEVLRRRSARTSPRR